MKKYFVLVIFTIITLMSSMVFASASAMFEVVEDNICTIKVNDYSKFEKKLISSDISKRQVTLQMKITNDSVADIRSGEVVLVLDNSKSMIDNEVSSGVTRKDAIFNSTKNLINDLLSGEHNLKVGIVSFSSVEDQTLAGTINDAQLVSELTANATELNNAIDSIACINGQTTDLEAGITLGEQLFSNANINKYMIILTDGLPNVAIDYDHVYFSDDVINKSKTKLQELTNSYEVIAMLTGIQDSSATVTGTTYTYGQYAEMVFGTQENPTTDIFYNINDPQIEETLQDIYKQLTPVSKTLKDIKIIDYFPQKIVDNFDFAYVASPNIGSISAVIDTTNNSIVWTIGNLASGETAYVQYTLTLKDNYSSDILGLILDTNEKVDITYTDFDGTPGSKTSDVTPKVRVTEPAPELPKTGKTSLIIAISLIATSIGAISGFAFLKIVKKMKQ